MQNQQSDNYQTRIHSRYLDAIYSNLNRLDRAAYEKNAAATRRLFAHFLPQNKDARVLDLGCGVGYFLYALKKMRYTHIEGIDISSQQVNAAKKQNLPVTHADLFDFLAEKKEHYDAIIATDLLEHLHKDQLLRLADQCHTALKTNGRLICSVPNANSPFEGRLRYKDLTHELSFTEETLSELFKVTGFEPIHIAGMKPRPRTAKACLRWVTAWLFRTAWKLYMIAEIGAEARNVPLEFKLMAVAIKTNQVPSSNANE